MTIRKRAVRKAAAGKQAPAKKAQAKKAQAKTPAKTEASQRVYGLTGTKTPRKGSVMAIVVGIIGRAKGKTLDAATITARFLKGGHKGERTGKLYTAKTVTDALWHGVQQGVLKVVSGKKVNLKSKGETRQRGGAKAKGKGKAAGKRTTSTRKRSKPSTKRRPPKSKAGAKAAAAKTGDADAKE